MHKGHYIQSTDKSGFVKPGFLTGCLYMSNGKYTSKDIDKLLNQIDNLLNVYLSRIDPELNYNNLVKIKATTFKDAMYFIYTQLFKPDKKQLYDLKTIIDYDDIELLQALSDKYLSMCNGYNKHLGIDGFKTFIGISDCLIDEWSNNPTCLQYGILKTIRDQNRNSFEESLQDTDLGRMALANNSATIGLNYNYVAAAQVAAATAPKLENIADRYKKPPQIASN